VNRFHRLRKLCCIAALAVLASCAATSGDGSPSSPAAAESTGWAAFYSSSEVAAGKVFTLDPRSSAIRIYAFSGGKAPKLGHNHVLGAPQFTGFLYIPPQGPAGARFDIELRLDQLDLDRPEYRANLGEAFEAALAPEAIANTREHMLGPDNLQAAQFPFLRMHSVEIAGAAPKIAARVQVELHGQRHEYWVPLDVDGLPSHVSVAGSFVVRQSDFGVQAYAVLGGFLAVQDELVIEFHLLGN
jgi:polyisoprenoid-binding protein YceI